MSILRQLYKQSDYHDNIGMIFNTDCMKFMPNIKQGVFNITLTDTPLRYSKRGLKKINDRH